jgi:hypothetical protein
MAVGAFKYFFLQKVKSFRLNPACRLAFAVPARAAPQAD